MSGRAIRGWLILGPQVLAVVILAGLVGGHRRHERARRDTAAASGAAAEWLGKPDEAVAALKGSGYDHVVYRRSAVGAFVRTEAGDGPAGEATGRAAALARGEGRRLSGGIGGPERLPAEVAARLGRLDRAFAATLGGRPVAVAPVQDASGWDVVGAVLVAGRTPEPARFPAWVLLLGAAGLLLSWGALRREPVCSPWVRGGLVLAPGAGAGAAVGLLAPGAAAGAGIVTAAWLVMAGVGVSLLPLDRRPLALREATVGWGFLAPSLAHLLVFSVGPIAFALWLSFHQWSLIEPERPFVGLANYAALAQDTDFLRSLLNTAVYVLFVPVGMAVALGLALLVNRPFRGVRVVRAVLFLPYITSFVAISLVWKWMYEPDFGVFNLVLHRLGLGGLPWLSSPGTAMMSLQLLSVWMYSGYMMILFLAGLQSIPESLYESARLDGASAWQRFRHITLPLLRPTTFFVLVTMVIFMFQVFTAVYVMTEGGPLHATDVIVYHIYRNAWEYLRMGYASAMAWVLFAVVFVLTMVQWRWIGRERV